MRYALVLFWTFQLFAFSVISQPCINKSEILPTSCLEIESILVDACTTNEGLDEMARIRIGPNPIALNSLVNVTWTSSNPWQGYAMFNASNLAKLSTINAQIAAAGNCGRVIKIEPGETLPAYAKLLLITSTLYNVSAQDFSGLTDTLYVALHNNTSVTQGHFNNYGTSASRTFIFGTASCTDVVTYDRSFLRKRDGTLGAENGSTVYFTYNGTPTYGNSGCSIPLTQLTANAGSAASSYCQTDLVLLQGTVSGSICYKWSLANPLSGQLSDSTSLATVFTAKTNFIGPVKVYLYAYGNCNKLIKDSVEFVITAPTDTLKISDIIPGPRCNKNSLSLQAFGSNKIASVNWSTSGVGTFIGAPGWNVVYVPAPVDTGIIWIKVNQILVCGKLLDSISVDFRLAPDGSFFPSTVLICSNVPLVDLNPKEDGGVFMSPYVVNKQFLNPGIAGFYPIKYVIQRNGCSDSSNVLIEVRPKADARFTLSDSVVCLGSPIILVNFMQTAGVFTGYPISGNSLVPNTPGSFPLKYVVNNGACLDSCTRLLVIENQGNSEFLVPDSVLCEGDAPIIMEEVNKGGIFDGWYVTENSFSPVSAGLYPIMHVYGTGKCADTSYHYIVVHPKPRAKFVYNPKDLMVFDTISFQYAGTAVNKYQWNFGDGKIAATANPTHVYEKDKTYPVYLYVENTFGCLDTAYEEVLIKADVHFYVPNAFTPDENGLNDRFRVSYLGIRAFEMRIYSRWGELLYLSTDIDEGWNGDYKEVPCAGGVYFYVVSYTDANGRPGGRHGTVTLLR